MATVSTPARPSLRTPMGLARKQSLQQLTANSALRSSVASRQSLPQNHSPLRNTLQSPLPDLILGDMVEVPGSMRGIVRFIGSIEDKPGIFVGVELIKEFRGLGKNDGSVNGKAYFKTNHPNSGIFTAPSNCIRLSRNASRASAAPTPTIPRPSFVAPPSTPSKSKSPTESPLKMAPIILPSLTPPEESTEVEQIAELKARIQDKDREMRQLEQDKLEQREALEEMERQVSLLQGFLEKKSPPRQSLLPVEDVEEDVEALRNLIKERDEKIKLMREENEKRRSEFRVTLEQVEKTSEEANRIYESKIQELELIIKDKQDEISILQLNLDTIAVRRDNHDEQIEESTEEMAGQLKVLEGVVSEMEGYLIQSRERINELESEVEALHHELSQSQSRVRVLEDQVRSRPSSSDSHPQKRQMITFLEREVERLKSENEALHTKFTQDSTDTEQIAGLKHIVSELTRHNVETESQNQKLKKELLRLSASPDDTLLLKRKLESAEKDKQRLSKELTELEAMVESKVFREEELEREVAKLRRESSRSTDRHNILSSPIEEELWCEICEVSGHDILGCKAVFGDKNQLTRKNESWCDNCEMNQHNTTDCPHGNEVF